MASRPPIFHPSGLTKSDRDRAYDRRRLNESETRRLYSTKAWKVLRASQLRVEPFCRLCQPRLVWATVCDHVEPHRGDVDKFWSGPFQSLCEPCHNSVKQAEERAMGGGG